MIPRSRFWIASLAGLLAMAMTAAGQEGRERSDKTAVQDHAALVAHGLAMAIEAFTMEAQAGPAARGDQVPEAAQALRQHARHDYEASDRLFRQAGQGLAALGLGGGRIEAQRGEGEAPLAGPPAVRFYTAANEYASTLRRAEATADIAELNHAIKEAVDTFLIRQLARTSGRSSEAIDTLLQHARAMDRDSREILVKYDKYTRDREERGDRDQRPGSIATLAHQGQMILRALADLSSGPEGETKEKGEGKEKQSEHER
ncbi:MAG: hypothetical protein IRY99_19870 [Isosphaeraceae bacterium]|nr:hypothetical protein [Isosphaeraceae bacterium]